MTDTRPSPDSEPSAHQDALGRLEDLLTQWRAEIDELLVQLNLAGKDVRDEISRRVAAAQDAELAARSRLGDLGHDVLGALSAQRQSARQALADLRLVYESAKEAAERHRS